MRYTGHVFDTSNFHIGIHERPDSGFPSLADTFNEHGYLFDFMVFDFLGRVLARYLGGICRAFTRSFEAGRTRTRPRQRFATRVGERHDGVIERRLDVHLSTRNCTLLLFSGFRLLRHELPYSHITFAYYRLNCAGLFWYGRFSESVDRGPATLTCDERRDNCLSRVDD